MHRYTQITHLRTLFCLCFEKLSLTLMKKTHHSAEAEPSVERSDNTSTSIRISSALSRCRALTLKPSLERRKGAAAVWDRTQASLRRQGGWRTNSQEWDEMLACRRRSCGELCLLLRCSYLISASTIILIPRTSLTKANQFLGFPSEVSEKLHKNSPKTQKVWTRSITCNNNTCQNLE